MLDKLLKNLGVRPNEVARLLLAAGVFFLVQVDDGIVKSVSQALFNTRMGVEHLPEMYTWISLVFSALMVMLSWLTGLVAREKLLYGLIGSAAAVFAGNSLFLMLGHFSIINLPPYFYSYLFITSELTRSVLNFQVWIIAGGICYVSRAKVFFPILAAAAVLGDITGGFFVRFGGSVLSPYQFFAFSAMIVIAVLFMVRTLMRRFFVVEEESADESSSLSENTRYLLGSGYLILLFFISLTIFAVYTTVHYGFNVITLDYFSADPESERKITEFLGLFFGVTGVATLIATLFLLTPLLRWLGTSKINTAIGLTYLSIALMLLAVATTDFGSNDFLATIAAPAFWPLLAIFVGNVINYLLLDSVVAPTYQVLVQLIPARNSDGTRMVMEGGFFLLGGLAGAGLTALHAQGMISLQHLFILLIVLGVGLTAAGMALKRSYKRELVKAVRNQDIGLENDNAADAIGVLADESPDFLKGLLTHRVDGIRNLGIEITRRFPSPGTQTVCLELFNNDNLEIRASAIRATAPSGMTDDLLRAIVDCISDNDMSLQGDALRITRNLLEETTPDDNAKALIQSAALDAWSTDDMPAAHLSELIMILELVDDDATSCERQTQFSHLLNCDDKNEHLLAGIQAARHLNQEGLLVQLTRYIGHADAQVREAVVETLGARGEVEGILVLLEHLEESDPDVISALQKAIGDNVSDAVEKKIGEYLPISTCRAWELMVGCLNEENTDLLLNTFLTSAESRLEQSNRNAIMIGHLVATEQNSDLLVDQINLQIHRVRSGVVGLLGTATDADMVADLLDRLEESEGSEREAAVELIENIADRSIVRWLLPILESDPENRLDLATGNTDWRPRNTDEVLSLLSRDPDPWSQRAVVWTALNWGRSEIFSTPGTDNPPGIVTLVHELKGGEMIVAEEKQPMSALEKITFLKESPFFHELPLEELVHIASHMKEEMHKPGTVVIQENTTGDKMYVAVSGELEVTIGGGPPVATLTEMQVFGEQALLDEEPRSASITTRNEAHLLSLDRDDFHRILRRYSSIAFGMLRVLSKRLREAQKN